MPRRSTIADKPELDDLLLSTMVEHNGHKYLPLSAPTIHKLSPYWKGAKPIADMKLFECIMITKEVNAVHADHVVAALKRIGQHCHHLLVVAPIQTTELGNVFNREADNVSPGNDWCRILECFPNLKQLMFIHPIDVPTELSRYTYFALHAAVANRQYAQGLESFGYNGPPGVLMNFAHNTTNTTTTVASSNTMT
ncbi:uncharacterized protein K460DRAFT_381148 [Cucurbitaria berberidis CBS 394.84]|uniref:Uncharacterized protein n=1 Tax=Cucurbitaria berberidis CBS 394.84 TaxID=1168544 RepID=A0A9P4L2Z8_9PLEO|nr:uncharacterized protein K460DRAFT_381148 [Cucurbitaria berberidis CBS 394.84]KAF1840306.1 hypothetical protein K460DRAFT_381148 [Cucurbitaria berberidis CBS 394.84]